MAGFEVTIEAPALARRAAPVPRRYHLLFPLRPHDGVALICGIQSAYDRRVSVKPAAYLLNAYLRPFPCDVHQHGSRPLVITKRKTRLAHIVPARLARGYLWLP